MTRPAVLVYEEGTVKIDAQKFFDYTFDRGKRGMIHKNGGIGCIEAEYANYLASLPPSPWYKRTVEDLYFSSKKQIVESSKKKAAWAASIARQPVSQVKPRLEAKLKKKLLAWCLAR